MNRVWCVWLVCACVTLGVVMTPQQGRADDQVRLLEQALQQYDLAQQATDRDARLRGFGAAEQVFRQLIAGSSDDGNSAGSGTGNSGEPKASFAPVRNASLYVNLGNAALQAERLGPAVWAYRRALQLEPTHSQAQQNLSFARQTVPERYRREANSALLDTLFFWNAMYSRAQVLGFAGGCFLLAACLFAAGISWRQSVLRSLALVPLLCWIVCLGSTMLGSQSKSVEAVVIAAELVVHSADSENSAPRFAEPITSGVEVTVLRQRERWTEIELAGGRTGWVLNSGLEKL